MTNRGKKLLWLSVGSVLAARLPALAAGTTYTLDGGGDVQLNVNSTYSYQLIEKSTQQSLLSENLSSFAVGGTTYNATAFNNVTQGVNWLDGTLTLSTTSKHPATTTAHVRFSFGSSNVLQVSLNRAAGLSQPTAISERFADAGAHYYGIWEANYGSGIDNRGQSQNFDGQEASGVKVNGVFAASARSPFYMTSNKVAVYNQSVASGSYQIASPTNANSGFSFNAPSMTYQLMYGGSGTVGGSAAPRNPYKEMLGHYKDVAGPAYRPPTWAFDTIFWRDDNHQLPAGSTATSARTLALDDAQQLRNNNLHASSLWFDRPYGTDSANRDSNVQGWGDPTFDASFSDPGKPGSIDGLVQSLQGYGLNTMVWAANKANNQLYTEASKAGYLQASSSLTPAVDMKKLASGTNPSSATWFQGKLDTLMSHGLLDATNGVTGIKGFKIDRGGEGEMPLSAINEQTTLFQQTAFQAMQARNFVNGQNDFFNFTRNINDTGRQYAGVWSGDADISFQGLSSSVMNGIRSGLMNFPMWGSDTGGYHSVSGPPNKELFARWLGFSAYSPIMEILNGPTRTIWYQYDSQLVGIAKKHTDAHHDLIPYVRSGVYSATQTGVPMMRAMVIEYPNDPNVANMADQYMYGASLLVAPVTTAGAVSRSVYLPAGNWVDYNNRTTTYRQAAGGTITAAAPLDTIPVFAKEGAIIPRGDIVQGNNNWSGAWAPKLRVEMFPSTSFGSSFDYYTGSAVQTLTSAPFGSDVLVSFGDLGLAGELNIYLGNQPAGVSNGGIVLLAGTDYTWNGQYLDVPFQSGQLMNLDISGAMSLWQAGGVPATFAVAAPEPGAAGMLLCLGGASLLRRRRVARR